MGSLGCVGCVDLCLLGLSVFFFCMAMDLWMYMYLVFPAGELTGIISIIVFMAHRHALLVSFSEVSLLCACHEL